MPISKTLYDLFMSIVPNSVNIISAIIVLTLWYKLQDIGID